LHFLFDSLKMTCIFCSMLWRWLAFFVSCGTEDRLLRLSF
jgi:hypothetical protein